MWARTQFAATESRSQIVFPGIQPVVDYARAAFHHVELAVASLDPATMGEIPARSKEKDTDSWATNALMFSSICLNTFP